MIAVPAVGAAAVAALPRSRDETAKQAALGVSLLVLLLAVLATVAFDAGGERFQLTTSVSWIPDFGVDFALGVDGIALVMLLLIGVLVPVVVLASWRDEPTGHRSMKTFFAWLLLLLAVLATVAFDAGGERFQLTTSVSWIPDFGVDFALGVDGIALVMLLLIGVLVPVVVLASWRDEPTGHRSMKTFFAWLLLLESLMVGVFAATDVFL